MRHSMAGFRCVLICGAIWCCAILCGGEWCYVVVNGVMWWRVVLLGGATLRGNMDIGLQFEVVFGGRPRVLIPRAFVHLSSAQTTTT